MAKTIREIANEIGVSKQAIFKKIKREPLSTGLQGLITTVDGRLMVSVDGESLIKQAFLTEKSSTSVNQLSEVDDLVDDSSTKIEKKLGMINDLTEAECKNNEKNNISDILITTLQRELEIKNEQIRELNIRLSESNAALVAAQQTAQAAQALHAGMIQRQLGECEENAEIHISKSEKASRKG